MSPKNPPPIPNPQQIELGLLAQNGYTFAIPQDRKMPLHPEEYNPKKNPNFRTSAAAPKLLQLQDNTKNTRASACRIIEDQGQKATKGAKTVREQLRRKAFKEKRTYEKFEEESLKDAEYFEVCEEDYFIVDLVKTEIVVAQEARLRFKISSYLILAGYWVDGKRNSWVLTSAVMMFTTRAALAFAVSFSYVQKRKLNTIENH
ncbi:predicted protein [Sclerotinia sclerotiorum 1980 UF-70]|uniref:Uncharacterized protein n=1 Tax=Sclerotinia sclerotiorum (strain ATCC 18683 / 1980 / Ss-1) TaxID=665079 RepID=A7ELQ2_SCLS1|nr:predicted protein [Sclerotinia sclerotiorum 1980 UF-70]EDO03768.1 predicted protein [Sclerotinia sclerotiorum 1980 UF-70]